MLIGLLTVDALTVVKVIAARPTVESRPAVVHDPNLTTATRQLSTNESVIAALCQGLASLRDPRI